MNFNTLTLRAFVFPYFYREYGAMSYLYILFLIMALTIMFIFIPQKMYQQDYTKSYQNSSFKYLYNTILVLKVILKIYVASSIIKKIDYIPYNIFYFIVGILLVSIIISRLKNSDIIELSTWFVIFGIVLYFLAFLHTVPFDLSIMRVFEFKNPSLAVYLFILLIYSDNILIFLTNKERYVFNKKTIILSVILQFVFFSFELYQMIFSAGEILFKDYEWIGFISLSFQKVSDYIGNLDFVYLYIVTMSSVLNSAFILSTIRNSFKKNSIMLDVSFVVLALVGCILLSLLSIKSTLTIFIIVAASGGILIIWLGKEYRNARKNRKESGYHLCKDKS